MKTFTVNKNVYPAKEFDFNLVCDLEDEGISLEMMEDKPLSIIRAYFRLCSGKSRQDAGQEIEKHLISGGSMKDISEAMGDAMEHSGFFQALREKAQKEAQADQSEAQQTAAASHSADW